MPFALTPDQRIFLNLYARQYNQVQEQIVRLQDQISRLIPISNELRHHISSIYTDVVRSEDRMRYAGQTMSNATSQGVYATTTRAPAPIVEPTQTYSVTFSIDDLMVSETTRLTFSDIQNPLNTECPIRLEPFEPNAEVAQINRCGHIFSPSELEHWFQSHTRCPTCRTELRPQQQQQQQQDGGDQNLDQLLTTIVYDLLFPRPPSDGFDLSNNNVSRRQRRVS